MKSSIKNKAIPAFALLAAFVYFSLNAGVVHSSSSANFIINADTISFGGGFSSSTNYIMEDTIGDVVFGELTSASFISSGGYIPMITGGNTVSASYPSSVSLSPAIRNTAGGRGNGQFDISVTTDVSAGYSLFIRSTTDPALASSNDSFANYSPSVSGTPDLNWSVGASDARFGFTPEGTNIANKYKDNGSSCNTGSGNTSDTCWDSITTTNKLIAGSTSPNSPTGVSTGVKLRSEAGSARNIRAGSYQATLVITASAN